MYKGWKVTSDMRKKQLPRKSSREKSQTWFDSHEFWTSAAWGFLSIALALLALIDSSVQCVGVPMALRRHSFSQALDLLYWRHCPARVDCCRDSELYET
jgi:hypothetical protein